jgi:hypothetical protein
MGHEFSFGGLLARFQANQSFRGLAPSIIGDGDDREFPDCRVAVDDALNFRGGSVLAAALNHVLRVVHNRGVTFVADNGQIAGMKPPVADGLGGGLGLLPI